MLFFFQQKTAYELRISDWGSDVCSSDLAPERAQHAREPGILVELAGARGDHDQHRDRKSVVEGERVSVRVDLGARRILNNTIHTEITACTDDSASGHTT